MNARSETARLRSLFTVATLSALKPGEVSGWDEMQGYPEYNPVAAAYGYDTVGWNPFSAIRSGLSHVPGLNQLPGLHPSAPRPPARPPAPMLPLGTAQAGQAGPRTLLAYMGLGSKTLDHTATSTDFAFSAEPQSAFRGRRLVIAARYTSGATGILVTITQPLTVSGMPQTPAPAQPAPIEMFDANATYSMLDLQIATTATQITIGFTASQIPASGESVSIAAGLYGEWAFPPRRTSTRPPWRGSCASTSCCCKRTRAFHRCTTPARAG